VGLVNGIKTVYVNIVMMRTPDGHGRLELTKFRNPKLVEIEPAITPPNAPGSVMFTVESVDDTVAHLRANGAELRGTLRKRSPPSRNQWRQTDPEKDCCVYCWPNLCRYSALVIKALTMSALRKSPLNEINFVNQN
jgi:hypothetical protein